MRLTAVYIALFFVMLATMSSCDSDDPTSVIALTDIAVLRSVDDGMSVFAVNEAGTTRLLKWNHRFDTTNVKTGNAVIIRYIPGTSADAPINLQGYSPVTNATVKVDNMEQNNDWDNTPIYLQSYTVVDRRLIIHGRMPYSTEMRRLLLVVDESTINDPTPTAYIVQNLPDTTPTFERSYYIGFNLSGLVERYSVNRLKVMVNNSNLPIDNFVINIK